MFHREINIEPCLALRVAAEGLVYAPDGGLYGPGAIVFVPPRQASCLLARGEAEPVTETRSAWPRPERHVPDVVLRGGTKR